MLSEVGNDRLFNDLAGRLCHQPAHPGQLAHLLDAAPRPGVNHHEDRVESLTILPKTPDHCIGHLIGDRDPGINDFVMTLAIGDQPSVVLIVGLPDVRLGGVDQFLFFLGDHQVSNTD